MYMCDRIFDFIHFYDFLVGFCNCFDGVVFSVLYFSFQYCLIKCVCLEKKNIEILWNYFISLSIKHMCEYFIIFFWSSDDWNSRSEKWMQPFLSTQYIFSISSICPFIRVWCSYNEYIHSSNHLIGSLIKLALS